MGLSNEERFSKIAHTINHLQDQIPLLKSVNKNFARLVKKMWVDFLGFNSNGIFWLMGDELSSDKMSGGSLVSVAFESHTPTPSNVLDLSKIKDDESFYSQMCLVKDRCSMDILINNDPKGAVVYLYHACENITYAAFRYKDKFAKELKALNNTVRQIQGEIFKEMLDDEDYFRAYLLKNIIDKCLTYNENDLVNQWAVKHNLQHDVRLHEGMEKDWLFHTWRKIQMKEVGTQERLEILLKLCGRRFHYGHQHKQLLKMIADHNWMNQADQVDVERIQKILKDCLQKKAEYDEDQRNDINHNTCDLTGNYIDRLSEVCNYKYRDEDEDDDEDEIDTEVITLEAAEEESDANS